MTRINADLERLETLEEVAKFKEPKNNKIREVFETLSMMPQHANNQRRFQKLQSDELRFIEEHEQLNVLQSLLYSDEALKNTLDFNHEISRRSYGFLSPNYRVIYTAEFDTPDDPDKQTIFDPPSGTLEKLFNVFISPTKSLADPDERMEYVREIAKDFHGLMTSSKQNGVEDDLRTILRWKNE